MTCRYKQGLEGDTGDKGELPQTGQPNALSPHVKPRWSMAQAGTARHRCSRAVLWTRCQLTRETLQEAVPRLCLAD